MPARGQRVLEAGNSLPASGHYGAYQDSIWRSWRECRGEFGIIAEEQHEGFTASFFSKPLGEGDGSWRRASCQWSSRG